MRRWVRASAVSLCCCSPASGLACPAWWRGGSSCCPPCPPPGCCSRSSHCTPLPDCSSLLVAPAALRVQSSPGLAQTDIWARFKMKLLRNWESQWEHRISQKIFSVFLCSFQANLGNIFHNVLNKPQFYSFQSVTQSLSFKACQLLRLKLVITFIEFKD